MMSTISLFLFVYFASSQFHCVRVIIVYFLVVLSRLSVSAQLKDVCELTGTTLNTAVVGAGLAWKPVDCRDKIVFV